MDFSWTQEQIQLKAKAIKFAQKELNNGLIERDKAGIFNLEGWKRCGQFGIHGLPIPKEYGGIEVDPLTIIYALEGLGYGCKDSGLLFSINAHMWGCEIPILTFGSEEQKKKYLPRLCSSEFIGGNAMTETDSGSDAYSLSTTAERRGDKYFLNGSKTFVSNGPIADVFVVFATVDRSKGAQGITSFLVEKNSPGLSLSSKIEKMGLRTSMMGDLFFDQCEVSVENRLGREGVGVAIFTHSMECSTLDKK